MTTCPAPDTTGYASATTVPATVPALATAGSGTVRARRYRAAATLCALAVLPATATFGTPAAVAAEAKPDALVTMGDSFISGEGARWQGNAEGLKNFGGIPQALRDATDRVKTAGIGLEKIYSPGCHRADAAVIGAGTPKRFNIACSGAATTHLSRNFRAEESQLARLRTLATENNVRVVVVSVGGNDVRLTDTMKVCADAWKNDRYCSTDTAVTGPAAERVRTVGAKVARAVEAVRAAVKDTGSSPRILVQSYPLPLASGKAATTAAHDENGWDRWSAYGCPFYNRDLRWIATGLGASLNREIKKAAVRTGADHVDLGRLLDGHQVCGKQPLQTAFAADGTVVSPPAAKAEWVRYVPRTKTELPAGEAQELLHPNYYGQQALGRCLTLVVGRLATAGPGMDAQCSGAAGKAPEQVGVTFTR
ncbi:GDSL-type esterase/lipase family protein [Streptomyces sp. NPDC008141]|uniref:GDSL-type esterase/lipase family protein n=1 Tax=Streptomyces sp. NPDC008141 TaxID=3364815 RepID=UPI0036EDFF87